MAGEGCGGARVGHNGVDGFGVAAGGVNNVYVATSVASMRGVGSVSYTHLTLPTILLV